MNNEFAIRIDQVNKTYKSNFPIKKMEAVKALSLEVLPGNIHGLLGPNGAGKTTTLKMIMGLVKPDSGKIEIFGKSNKDYKSRAKIGFLPEQPYFYTYLSADQTMEYLGQLCGLDKKTRKSRAKELLQMVGLLDNRALSISKFSRGMLQRLGIAQALINNPDLVILDEPSGGLDPVGQKEMRNIIIELQKNGKTVLLSSHQLTEIEAISSSVSILNHGSLVSQGEIENLLNPEDNFAITFDNLDIETAKQLSSLPEEVFQRGEKIIITEKKEKIFTLLNKARKKKAELIQIVPKKMSLEEYFINLLEKEAD